MTHKLTKAQMNVLRRMAAGSIYVSRITRKPLIKHGLIEFSHYSSDCQREGYERWHLTPAGRALAEKEQ